MAKAKKVQDVWQATEYSKKITGKNTEMFVHNKNGEAKERAFSSNYESYSVADARINFSEITGKVEYAKNRVALRKRNKIVGYIVPAEDIELLERYEDWLDAQEALKRKDEPTHDYDEVLAKLGLNDV
jgi:PHD/YefM family antitoxin component YafN of YafNO toxin-antitoxin module